MAVQHFCDFRADRNDHIVHIDGATHAAARLPALLLRKVSGGWYSVAEPWGSRELPFETIEP
jgi:hypothetical protein